MQLRRCVSWLEEANHTLTPDHLWSMHQRRPRRLILRSMQESTNIACHNTLTW